MTVIFLTATGEPSFHLLFNNLCNLEVNQFSWSSVAPLYLLVFYVAVLTYICITHFMRACIDLKMRLLLLYTHLSDDYLTRCFINSNNGCFHILDVIVRTALGFSPPIK